MFISFHWDSASAPRKPPHQIRVHPVSSHVCPSGARSPGAGAAPVPVCRHTKNTHFPIFSKSNATRGAGRILPAVWDGAVGIRALCEPPRPRSRPCSVSRVAGSSQALGNPSFLLAGVLPGPEPSERAGLGYRSPSPSPGHGARVPGSNRALDPAPPQAGGLPFPPSSFPPSPRHSWQKTFLASGFPQTEAGEGSVSLGAQEPCRWVRRAQNGGLSYQEDCRGNSRIPPLIPAMKHASPQTRPSPRGEERGRERHMCKGNSLCKGTEATGCQGGRLRAANASGGDSMSRHMIILMRYVITPSSRMRKLRFEEVRQSGQGLLGLRPGLRD